MRRRAGPGALPAAFAVVDADQQQTRLRRLEKPWIVFELKAEGRRLLNEGGEEAGLLGGQVPGIVARQLAAEERPGGASPELEPEGLDHGAVLFGEVAPAAEEKGEAALLRSGVDFWLGQSVAANAADLATVAGLALYGGALLRRAEGFRLPSGRGEAGYVLVSALFVVAILVTLAGAVTTTAFTSVRSARAWHDRLAAFYAAESGVNEALYRLIELWQGLGTSRARRGFSATASPTAFLSGNWAAAAGRLRQPAGPGAQPGRCGSRCGSWAGACSQAIPIGTE
ncbi:MAG: pilus assembly PilX N-terminal domain-containing protein [Clostridia bacterium]|nr:pilus assembly PilX N-terminal domain-containing protein [Clostridia bacterium]